MSRSPYDRPAAAKKPATMTPEFLDLIRRRTMPFLDRNGLSRPLPFLLEEAYLQGMKDAAQAMQSAAGRVTL